MKRFLYLFLIIGLVSGMLSLPGSVASAATTKHHAKHAAVKHTSSRRGSSHVARSTAVRHSARGRSATVRTVTYIRGRNGRLRRAVLVRHRYYEHFTGDSFAETDLTAQDSTAGEDPVVRAAALEALGNMNGTVVSIDPNTGRILAMVNQKLALSSGAEPCSTIKVSVALAALSEGIITKDTPVNLGGGFHLNLTEALAHSNNLYFETVGRELGFERVRHYANQFGLGELAGWNIPGEQLGIYPNTVLPESAGGVGRMCSFGEGVSMTPLQLGALVSAIANGGTLYYLQHPTTPAEAVNFTPKVKRKLDIGPIIPQISTGMGAAVQYGTARSLRASFDELPILGKTGTCSNNGTRYGWFASFADTSYGRIVNVIFLEGGRPTFGPKAAELTGVFYRSLWDHSYFATASKGPLPGGQITTQGVTQ